MRKFLLLLLIVSWIPNRLVADDCSDVWIIDCSGSVVCDTETILPFWFEKISNSECRCAPGNDFDGCGEETSGICSTLWWFQDPDVKCEDLIWHSDNPRLICLTTGPLGMYP